MNAPPGVATSHRVQNEEAEDEARFLDAIRNNADDNVVRLAYAEWLDRRDGVRAELIRSQIVLWSPACTGRSGCMFHQDRQDTTCDAWKRLLRLIDEAAADGRTEFDPRSLMLPEDWARIVTLPATISRLKAVTHLKLVSSHLVCIPPEIGEMASLEVFDRLSASPHRGGEDVPQPPREF